MKVISLYFWQIAFFCPIKKGQEEDTMFRNATFENVKGNLSWIKYYSQGLKDDDSALENFVKHNLRRVLLRLNVRVDLDTLSRLITPAVINMDEADIEFVSEKMLEASLFDDNIEIVMRRPLLGGTYRKVA